MSYIKVNSTFFLIFFISCPIFSCLSFVNVQDKQFTLTMPLKSQLATVDSLIKLEQNNNILNHLLLKKAKLLNHSNENNKALKLFIELSQKSDISDSILTHCFINTSLLYEELNLEVLSLEYLVKAKNNIDKYEQFSILPLYYLRKSSAHRVIGQKKISKEKIIKSIHYGEIYQNHEVLGQAYMVKAFVTPRHQIDSISHLYKRSIKHAFIANDKNTYVAVLSNLSNLYLRNNSIDSAYYYSKKAVHFLDNNTGLYDFPFIYRQFALVFETKNRLDSALYYYKKYYKKQLEYDNDNNIIAVNQISETFEKKAILKELVVNKTYKNIGFIISGIISILLFFIFYYYKKNRNLFLNETKTNKQLSLSFEREVFLQRELQHRVKNNLQLIIGLIELQGDDSIIQHKIKQQVFSISSGYDLLYNAQKKDGISLNIYTQKIIDYLISGQEFGDEPHISISIDKTIILDLKELIPFGLIINELLTNSIKHAQFPHKILEVTINCSFSEDTLNLDYKDNGPGVNKNTLYNNFIISSMIEQFKGEVTLCQSTNGLWFNFKLPIIPI